MCVSTATYDLLFRQICLLALAKHMFRLDIIKFLLPPKNQLNDSIIENCPKLGMGPLFDPNRCVITIMLLCSIMLVCVYPSVSVGRLVTGVLFAVLYPYW